MKTKNRLKMPSATGGQAAQSNRKAGSASFPGCDDANDVYDKMDFSPFDDERHCPRFRNLISRDPDMDAATVDELDPVQLELEQMLLHNVDRQKALTQQIASISTGDAAHSSVNAESKKKEDVQRHVLIYQTRIDCLDRTKTKGVTMSSSKQQSAVETVENVAIPSIDRLGRRRVFFWPQNHMPDKFWQFVSDICLPFDQEDVDMLKQLVRDTDVDRMSKWMKVPVLGKHYRLRHCEQQQQDDSKSPLDTSRKKSLKRKMSKGEDEIPNANKQSKLSNGDESLIHLGPLTERLVQALIDEQHRDVASPLPQAISSSTTKEFADSNGTLHSPNKRLVQSLNLGNMAALERRIKKELEMQGLLDYDSDGPSASDCQSTEDEVTTELRKRQRELRDLAIRNRKTLETLVQKCNNQIQYQKVAELLEKADNEVQALFNKYYSLVPKRKPCNKKERDALSEALKQRRKAVADNIKCLPN